MQQVKNKKLLHGRRLKGWQQSAGANVPPSSPAAAMQPLWRGGGGSRTPWSGVYFYGYPEGVKNGFRQSKNGQGDIFMVPKMPLVDI